MIETTETVAHRDSDGARFEVETMLHHLHHVSPATAPTRKPADAEPPAAGRAGARRAAEEQGDRVELAGARPAPGPGYGRRMPPVAARTPRDPQDVAIAALPRDADGRPDPGAVVEPESRRALSEAVDGIAAEGLKSPAAVDRLVRAVDHLFDQYERDLQLHPAEVAALRRRFVEEVTEFFERAEALTGGAPLLSSAAAVPGELMTRLQSELADLRERLEARREDVLLAAGDLSRVLSERTLDAAASPDDERAAGRLGRLLAEMNEAALARSTRALRDDARRRLSGAGDAPEPPASAPSTDPEPVAVARRFLARLETL